VCKIKLNKEAKNFIDDMKFHNCVNLTAFSKKGSIKFLPPDGEFEFLSYR
jgi:Adaptor complexes medium subunit family